MTRRARVCGRLKQGQPEAVPLSETCGQGVDHPHVYRFGLDPNRRFRNSPITAPWLLPEVL